MPTPVLSPTEIRAKPRASSAFPVRQRMDRIALYLFVVALAITIVRGVKQSSSQFVGRQAFVSADVATTARTFATEGVWNLHGVPVNNNPPTGLHDSYTHWPPLLPILLSFAFRLFGASEHTAQIFMLCILAMTAVLISRLGFLWLGPTGILAGYFWLTLPVIVQFGDLVAQESLAMLFVVAAVIAFHSGHAKFGALLLFFGVLSSWEAALIVPGIWLVDRRMAVPAALGTCAGVLAVGSLFLLGSAGLAVDALQTVKFYAGLSPVYSNLLPHDRAQINFAQQLSGVLWNHLWMLGALGLAAMVQLFATRPKVMLLSALAAPWLIWTLVMRTHVAVHDFELLIAAPLTALSLAWLATADLRLAPSRNSFFKTGAICALALVQAVLLPKLRPTPDYSPVKLIRYGQDIRRSTEPGSIVMAPLESSVPIFYSDRHIIRGINDDQAVSLNIPRDFHGSIYLAIPPSLAGNFAGSLSKATIISSTPDAIVARL